MAPSAHGPISKTVDGASKAKPSVSVIHFVNLGDNSIGVGSFHASSPLGEVDISAANNVSSCPCAYVAGGL